MSGKENTDLRQKLIKKGYLQGPGKGWMVLMLLHRWGLFLLWLMMSFSMALLSSFAYVIQERNLTYGLLFFHFFILYALIILLVGIAVATLFLLFQPSRPSRLPLLLTLPTLFFFLATAWKPWFSQGGLSWFWQGLFLFILLGLTYQGLWGMMVFLYRRHLDLPARFQRRGKLLIAFLCLGFVSAGIMGLLRPNQGDLPPYEEKNFTLPHYPEKTLIFLVDGLDRSTLQTWECFKELREGGKIVFIQVPSFLHPAIYWTSLLSGFLPEAHGVTLQRFYRFSGIPVGLSNPPLPQWCLMFGLAKEGLATQLNRRVPLLWEWVAVGGVPTEAYGVWSGEPPWTNGVKSIDLQVYLNYWGDPQHANPPPCIQKEKADGDLWRLDHWVLKSLLCSLKKKESLVYVAYLPSLDLVFTNRQPHAPMEVDRLTRKCQEHLEFLTHQWEKLRDQGYHLILMTRSSIPKMPEGVLLITPIQDRSPLSLPMEAVTPYLLSRWGFPILKLWKNRYPQLFPMDAPTLTFIPKPQKPQRGERVQPSFEILKSLGYLE